MSKEIIIDKRDGLSTRAQVDLSEAANEVQGDKMKNWGDKSITNRDGNSGS